MKNKINIAVLILIVAVAGFLGYQLLQSSFSNPKKEYFYVHTGDNIETVKANLKKQFSIKLNGFELA